METVKCRIENVTSTLLTLRHSQYEAGAIYYTIPIRFVLIYLFRLAFIYVNISVPFSLSAPIDKVFWKIALCLYFWGFGQKKYANWKSVTFGSTNGWLSDWLAASRSHTNDVCVRCTSCYVRIVQMSQDITDQPMWTWHCSCVAEINCDIRAVKWATHVSLTLANARQLYAKTLESLNERIHHPFALTLTTFNPNSLNVVNRNTTHHSVTSNCLPNGCLFIYFLYSLSICHTAYLPLSFRMCVMCWCLRNDSIWDCADWEFDHEMIGNISQYVSIILMSGGSMHSVEFR